MNFVAPFLENVLHFPVTRQIYTMSIAPREGQIMGDDSVEARTADGQVVRVDASVIFALQPDAVVDTHQKWQGRYVDNLIRPQARGIIRDAVSQFGIEEVYGTQRFALSALIEEALEVQFEEGGLIMHDFVLRNIAFSPEYAASVEQKQIAEKWPNRRPLSFSNASRRRSRPVQLPGVREMQPSSPRAVMLRPLASGETSGPSLG